MGSFPIGVGYLKSRRWALPVELSMITGVNFSSKTELQFWMHTCLRCTKPSLLIQPTWQLVAKACWIMGPGVLTSR